MVVATIPVLIAPTKAFAEIVVVLVLVDVVAVIAVVRVLIGVRILVVGPPPVLAVRLSGAEAFLVAVIHGLPERVRAVLIDLVVAASPLVAIDGSGVVVRIAIVIMVAIVRKTDLLLMDSL